MSKFLQIIIACLLFFGIVNSACKKDHYLDSGLHNAKYDGSILDYLKTRPDIFDTLVYVLEMTDLDQVVDKENVTLFAPTDMSFKKTILTLNRTLRNLGKDTVLRLDQIDVAIWKEFMSMYILDERYLLKDFPQLDTLNKQAFPGQGYVTRGNNFMNIGVLFNDVRTSNSQGDQQVIKYAGYRQLYFNSLANGGFVTAPVATSDIQPKNGVLHVLHMGLHSFGFNEDFRNIINLRGIKSID